MPVAGPSVILGIDVGGTGLKAALVEHDGTLGSAPVRTATSYPMTPDGLVEALGVLVAPLGAIERAAVGFPGMVRAGMVLSAPHFVTSAGPGSPVDPELQWLWHRHPLEAAVAARLGCRVRLANDADLQGLGVVAGTGLELVVTLGTGFGTALFLDGRLAPHLELAHHPLADGRTYNELLGDNARTEVGQARWSERVLEALAVLDRLVLFDHLWLGGGNAGRVVGLDDERITVVDNVAGITGAARLWADG